MWSLVGLLAFHAKSILPICLLGQWNGELSLHQCEKGPGSPLGTEQGFPYYPNHYLHHQVANWLVENRKKVMLTQKAYLQQAYGIQDPNATFPGPYSYKEYCHNVLDRRFWGDALVLYAISSMWALKITMINSKTLEEYRV